MLNGYAGKILHVNLTTGDFAIEEPPEDFYRKYMGGSALNLYYLLKEMHPQVDPLSPENILALSVGGPAGAPISGQSRLTSTAKSPLTGAIGDSQGGGYFPSEMKFSGFDAFIIRGKASHPVYLWVQDGVVELRDASHLWGKTTLDVEDQLKKELADNRIEVAQVGPAAENGVLFSAIINGVNRANGRTGMGAVMASKNLKAIAVRGREGRKKFKVADRKNLSELAKAGVQAIPGSGSEGLSKYGTAGSVNAQNHVGGLPTRNFSSGVFEGAADIDGTTLFDTYLKGALEGDQERQGTGTCFGCAIRCKRVVEIVDGRYPVDPRYGGPEYETLAALGSYCGVNDLNAVCKANELCNMYGIDTISCGGTIAWIMECYEAGLINSQDTGGIEIRFGDAEVLLQLIELITKREGIGATLALGSQQASEAIGKGTDAYLVTSHGQEFPAHMPRVKPSLALIYAVNPFGADHMSSEHDPLYSEPFMARLSLLGLNNPQPMDALNEEKVRFARITQYFHSLTDSLNLCQFVWGPTFSLYGPKETLDLVRYVTGWDVTMEELLQVGERRLNMMRAFNAREGIDRNQDILPKRMFEPLKGGPSDGQTIRREEFKAALEAYFLQSGWDLETGYPTREKLEQLELDWIADQVWP